MLRSNYTISFVIFLLLTVSNANADNGGNDTKNIGNNSSDLNRKKGLRSPQGIPNDGAKRRAQAHNKKSNRLSKGPEIDGVEIRTYDGSNNNLNFTDWGSTFAQLQRLGNANYSDGISSMIDTYRPGPREVSNTIVNQNEGENIPNNFGTSDFNWQWGQFIDHDIDLTDGSAEEPQNIIVPIGDVFFDPAGTGSAIIPFNRALFDPNTGTDTSNVRQQENEITSWIDGSMIYGSSAERAAALREGPDSPYLKTSEGNLLPFNTESLPNANGPIADPTSLFLAGDVRANEQIGLAAMHTLFVREHNRLAELLVNRDPNASAEKIFQTARRLVGAKVQIITYNEHLPALIGANAIPQYTGYNSSVNPTIFNEFSAAAFRLGHSMVSEQLLQVNGDGNAIPDGEINLANAFFNAPQIIQSEDDIDPILRGLASQRHQSIDVMVVHPLRNFLFGQPGAGGLDLTALNVQRGRDHGLPFYNDMRVAMGLSPVASFSQIGSDPEIQQSLQDAYGDVSKVDLWIGGLAETPLVEQGSQLGELFTSILTRQFTELRDGDRFWYENHLDENEMEMVRGTTLAGVIRDNTSIGGELQNNVFFVRLGGGSDSVGACIDSDGDGFGWNGFETCDPTESESDQTVPVSPIACIDTDGDGFGWNGFETCDPTESESDQTVPVSPSACIDTDGDGFGWNGFETCDPTESESNQTDPVSPSACIDTDGDGFGWNGFETCDPNDSESDQTDAGGQ